MRIIETKKYDYDDVLLLPKRSTLASRQEVDLFRQIKFLHSNIVYFGIPIMAANMDSVATIEAAKVFEEQGLFTCLHKFVDHEEVMAADLNPRNFAMTIGKSKEQLEHLEDNSHHDYFDYVCVDIANGYSQDFADFIKQVRESRSLRDKVIIAGNVCTPEMTEELILSGADIVKVGIGPGSHCTTRKQTGVGMPQFSAVVECADAAHGVGGRVIGDGGIKTPGDFAKCFGAGADFAMAGSLFAAHDENSELTEDGKVIVYGMSSSAAMDKYYGGVNNYRTSEGRITALNHRGPLEATIKDILGGLRSACTYIGAKEIKDFSKCATFVVVNNQLSKEYEKETIGQ